MLWKCQRVVERNRLSIINHSTSQTFGLRESHRRLKYFWNINTGVSPEAQIFFLDLHITWQLRMKLERWSAWAWVLEFLCLRRSCKMAIELWFHNQPDFPQLQSLWNITRDAEKKIIWGATPLVTGQKYLGCRHKKCSESSSTVQILRIEVFNDNPEANQKHAKPRNHFLLTLWLIYLMPCSST